MTYRHSFVTRVTHAAFSLTFFVLAITGAQIYFHKHWIPRAGTVHDIAAIVMIASGLSYLVQALASGSLRALFFTADDLPGAISMGAYYLRLRNASPAYGDYNPLQKLAYTAVLLMIAPLIAATGAALFFHVRAASVWHVGFAVELIAFFLGHMLMVTTTGLRRNLRAIVTGWYASDERSPCRRSDSAPGRRPKRKRLLDSPQIFGAEVNVQRSKP